MAKDTDPTFGGGSLDLDRFKTASGTGIRWGRVTFVGVASVLLAWFSGWVEVVLALFDIPISLLDGFAEFLGQVVQIIAGTPAVLVEGSWQEAAGIVRDAGPAAFVVAIAIVAATLYVFVWGVSRLGS